MPHYMYRWQLKSDAVKGLVEAPVDREGPARTLVQAFGGKLLCYYYTAGEHDGLAIVEMPDHVAAAALSLRAASSGGFARFETCLLLTTQEAKTALERAKATAGDYRPPGH